MPDIFDLVGQPAAAHSMIALSKAAETSFIVPILKIISLRTGSPTRTSVSTG